MTVRLSCYNIPVLYSLKWGLSFDLDHLEASHVYCSLLCVHSGFDWEDRCCLTDLWVFTPMKNQATVNVKKTNQFFVLLITLLLFPETFLIVLNSLFKLFNCLIKGTSWGSVFYYYYYINNHLMPYNDFKCQSAI